MNAVAVGWWLGEIKLSGGLVMGMEVRFLLEWMSGECKRRELCGVGRG